MLSNEFRITFPQLKTPMSVVVFIETPENNRGRFIAENADSAIAELGRRFPVGATVADPLRKGERVVTDSYTLAVRPLQTAPEKKQQTLF